MERRLFAAADPSGHEAVEFRHNRDSIAWEPFSKHRLGRLVNGGRAVFVVSRRLVLDLQGERGGCHQATEVTG
jgi:hypothetical protein